MLPAHDELNHYAECVGADLTAGQQAVIVRSIKGMTANEADAWMALLTAAEEKGEMTILNLGNYADEPTITGA